jgi:hypothetical protein
MPSFVPFNHSAVCLRQEHVLSPATRRKLSVHIEGHRPPAAAAGDGTSVATTASGDAALAAEGSGAGANLAPSPAGEAAASPAAAVEGAEEAGVELIGDMWSWKRRQELYGGFK